MATTRNFRKNILADLEITPVALGSVPAGNPGQLAVVTDMVGVNLVVRNGSGAIVPTTVSDARMYNAGRLDLVVDPVNGVSPPDGTTVVTQAEYTALGHPLRYLQDVIRILPPYQGFYIDVTLVAGTHDSMPDSGGPGENNLIATEGDRAFWPKVKPYNDGSGSGLWSIWNPVIHIHGDSDTILEAEQDGTIPSTRIITRTEGHWTEHEQQGKFVYITSGAAAGSKGLIVDNTNNQLTLCMDVSALGSCTFEIVEPAAVCTSNSGIDLHNNTDLVWIFNNIKFGTDSTNFGWITISGNSFFYNCIIFGDSGNPGFGSINPMLQFTQISDTYIAGSIYLEGGYGTYPSISIENSMIVPVTSQSSNMIILINAICYLNARTVLTTMSGDSFNNYLLDIEGQSSVYFSAHMQIIGNASCNGITFGSPYASNGGGGSPSVFGDTININNCAVGLTCIGVLVSLPDVVGSDNGEGWDISCGGRVIAQNPSNLVTTSTDIAVDGNIYSYSLIGSTGDEIIGPCGSSILETTASR